MVSYCSKIEEKIKEEIVYAEDGFYYWFPNKKGLFCAADLSCIIKILDNLNEEYEKELERYFSENSSRIDENDGDDYTKDEERE